MNRPIKPRPKSRRLVLIVGPETPVRDDLARGLIARGHAAVICSGPPGCVLLREDQCALVESADVTVIMPSNSTRRDVAAGLSLCARDARSTVIVEPSAVAQPPLGADFVEGGDGCTQPMEAVERVLREESRREGGGKGVADVTDIWL